MHTHENKHRKHPGAQSPGRDSKKQQQASELKLTDNRPEAAIQRKLQAAANDSPQAKSNSRFQSMAESYNRFGQQTVAQLARSRKKVKKGTVSGHGSLRRNKKGDLIPYKVPKGRTIVISAPPGATLGDISLVLNTTDNPDFRKIRKMVKISTNKDLWKNRRVVTLVRANTKIAKTPLQAQLLKDLDTGARSYDDLEGGEKGSLTRIESKAEFEQWAESYVAPETFQVKNGGETINDMNLEPFEDKLRSSKKSTAKQNEYIENDTFLSDYVDDNPDLMHITVNACSDDPTAESDFTGFQIDKK